MFKLSHLRPALAFTLALTVFAAHAQNKKNSSPPPKPAPKPVSRPAPSPTSRPGATNNNSRPGATNNVSHGPTISGASHGPTIAGANNHPQPTIGAAPHGPTTATAARPATAPGGRPLPAGAKPVTRPNGNSVVTRPNGRPSDVHDASRGMDVHHGLDGSRRVSVTRADHSRIVGMRGRPGFVERPYAFHGHEFARRTYYFHGRAYDRFYRGYDFRGAHFGVYAPGFYYRPAFYGWAYAGWAHPVVYGWGWGPSPWVGYYGYYFSPYAVYPGPAFWLTDYMISTDLAEQYQAEVEAGAVPPAPPAGAAPMLSEQDKQLIAGEVRNEIALENAEAQQTAAGKDVDPASSSIARMITDGKPHIFIVGGPLDLVDTTGNECAVSEGDALALISSPPADSPVAQLTVLASKGGSECAKSASVNVALADLQEMQNHMRERIDQGLADLQAKQGQGGLPMLPPSAAAPATAAPFVADAPPPDPNGAAEVTQQLAAADQSEQQVLAEAGQPADVHGPSAGVAPAPAGPPPTIALGQSIDEVTAAFGQPVTIINLGVKKIYQYKDMKVTFKAGRVTDIQ